MLKRCLSLGKSLAHVLRPRTGANVVDGRENPLPMRKYIPGTMELCGHPFMVADRPSFEAMRREIFDQGGYDFECSGDNPVIIDAGAHTGVAVARFKQLYPNAVIEAYEADPTIFRMLQSNAETFGWHGVTCFQEAVWTHDRGIDFFVEKSDSGGIVAPEDVTGRENIRVPSVRLADRIRALGSVDFLKMDIEGAETEVLMDCREVLGRVDHLVVEYHQYPDHPQTLHHLLSWLDSASLRCLITDATASVGRGLEFVCTIRARRKAGA